MKFTFVKKINMHKYISLKTGKVKFLNMLFSENTYC